MIQVSKLLCSKALSINKSEFDRSTVQVVDVSLYVCLVVYMDAKLQKAVHLLAFLLPRYNNPLATSCRPQLVPTTLNSSVCDTLSSFAPLPHYQTALGVTHTADTTVC